MVLAYCRCYDPIGSDYVQAHPNYSYFKVISYTNSIKHTTLKIYHSNNVQVNSSSIFTSWACASRAWLVLRLLYVPTFCVCVCSSAIITCATLRHSITMPLHSTCIATSAVEATGSLQAELAKVCQARLVCVA